MIASQDTDIKILSLFWQGGMDAKLIIKSGFTVSLFMDVQKVLTRLVQLHNLNKIPGHTMEKSVSEALMLCYALFGCDFNPGTLTNMSTIN